MSNKQNQINSRLNQNRRKKEAVGGLEKRYRDQLRNKEYKKSRKKMKVKKRDSTVYSTLSQTLLSGFVFVSITNNLY